MTNSTSKNTAWAPTPIMDRTTKICITMCLIGFGGFLLWGGLFAMAEGVNASGVIVAQDNHKKVQHQEGGIVEEILVKEGDIVTKGDVLIRMEIIQAESSRDELAQQMVNHSASIIRLRELKKMMSTDEADTRKLNFDVMNDFLDNKKTFHGIVNQQQSLFEQQWQSYQRDIDTQDERIRSLKTQRYDMTKQISANETALYAAQQDLDLRRQLLAVQQETLPNVQRAERDVANYNAEMARLRTQRNALRAQISETESEIQRIRGKFSEQIAGDLTEANAGALSTKERLDSAQDVLTRSDIIAPQSGKIINMEFTTRGGVIRPGEEIMSIVPDSDQYVASLRVRPQDRDSVFEGLDVVAQLSAYKMWNTPKIDGKVITVSADLKDDQKTGASYYEARVLLDASQLAENDRLDVSPGMPVDAFVASGMERTFLDYMFEPILGTMKRGTRMN